MFGSISLSSAAVPGLMGPVTREQRVADAFKAAVGALGGDFDLRSCPRDLEARYAAPPGLAVPAKHGPE